MCLAYPGINKPLGFHSGARRRSCMMGSMPTVPVSICKFFLWLEFGRAYSINKNVSIMIVTDKNIFSSLFERGYCIFSNLQLQTKDTLQSRCIEPCNTESRPSKLNVFFWVKVLRKTIINPEKQADQQESRLSILISSLLSVQLWPTCVLLRAQPHFCSTDLSTDTVCSDSSTFWD